MPAISPCSSAELEQYRKQGRFESFEMLKLMFSPEVELRSVLTIRSPSLSEQRSELKEEARIQILAVNNRADVVHSNEVSDVRKQLSVRPCPDCDVLPTSSMTVSYGLQ